MQILLAALYLITKIGGISDERAISQHSRIPSFAFRDVKFLFRLCGNIIERYRSNAIKTRVKTEAAEPIQLKFPPVSNLHKTSPNGESAWRMRGRRMYTGVKNSPTVMSAIARFTRRKFIGILIDLVRSTTTQTRVLPTKLISTRIEKRSSLIPSAGDIVLSPL